MPDFWYLEVVALNQGCFLRFLESIFQYLDISYLRHCWLAQLTERELHEQEGLDAASV